jgi:uncharacterized LabA/DUF88 family protein
MRSQSAIFVDAGYFIAAAATRLTGSSLRRGVNVDFEKLVPELIAMVEGRTGLPLLRVYWYDAGKNGNPDQDQEKVAALPKVKLRLGRIGVEGEQKGVDLRIGLDMVGHSRNGAVDTIYLLSGDDDLTEAVEEAQAQGVQVIVLAVPAKSGAPHGVSRNLSKAADDVEVLEGAVLDASVTAAVTAPPVPSPPAVPVAPSPGAVGIAIVAQASRSAKPSDPARRVSTAPAGPPTLAYSGSSGSKPYVAPEYEHDPAEVTASIKEVVDKAYEAWASTATEAQRAELLAGRPTIPRDLDRALLVDLSDLLGDYYLSEAVRVRLRSLFWDAVEAH